MTSIDISTKGIAATRVKRLNWGPFGADTGLGSQYYVRYHDDGKWGWHLTMGPEIAERYPTATAAKAAAQADYENRILSTLQPAAGGDQ